MKLFLVLMLLVAATAAGWFARERFDSKPQSAPASGPRNVLYYQSAMHPWIKSDKPGRCTICGMELTPVYEGEKGFDADGDVVPLSQSQIHVLQVQTEEAKVRPLTRTLSVAGMVDDDARRHRIISAYVDGRIDKLFANHHGIEVVAGEPLAMLYSPTLLQAEREYRQLSGELRKSAGLRLQQMGLTSEQIAALPGKSTDALTSEFLAPLTGTVVQHDVYEGQYVTAGEKLFEIADFSVMWFMFRAYEQDMPWIELNQEVKVTTPSLPGRTFLGKVTFIDPNFDGATRATQVRVELSNPIEGGRRPLLHRLYADGEVQAAAPEVLTVPRSAVIQTGPDSVVYVERGAGAYARTPLKTGRRGDVLVEIVSGLKAGERVVTNGNLLLDGQAEMNRAFASPAPPPTESSSLTDAQSKAVGEFLKVADAMADALAAENIPAFNDAAKPAADAAHALAEALRPREGVPGKLDPLLEAAHFTIFSDKMQARMAFHKFTMAAIPVLEPLRTAKGAPDFQVWECYMVDRILDDVPKFARWVQTGGRPGHNPFFGNDMLECAKEIKLEGVSR